MSSVTLAMGTQLPTLDVDLGSTILTTLDVDLGPSTVPAWPPVATTTATEPHPSSTDDGLPTDTDIFPPSFSTSIPTSSEDGPTATATPTDNGEDDEEGASPGRLQSNLSLSGCLLAALGVLYIIWKA